MKKVLYCLLVLLFTQQQSGAQILKRIGNKIKDKTGQETERTIKSDNSGNGNQDNNHPAPVSETNTTPGSNPGSGHDSIPPAVSELKVYANYDFVPGNTVLFEDHFTDDADGEFPAHWELNAGQAILNKIGGQEAFCLTDGNYVRVYPRMKNKAYLTDSFTVEYDYYYVSGAYSSLLIFTGTDPSNNSSHESHLSVGNHDANYTGSWGNVILAKEFPPDLKNDFANKWHHVAIAKKNGQLKVYVDQFRVLVVPDTHEKWSHLTVAGIGDEKEPIVVSNFRIAAGAGMNMLGKKFTDTKIVTHGINFDIDKATLRPESMGTLNQIVQVLTDNPEIRFEVGGHTDNTGTPAHNLTLSQQRAEAVKAQLVKMGIDGSRLSTKGYGDTKPISDNNTPEGRANNRRVEFVKQ